LIGMLAAAQGHQRHEPLGPRYAGLEFMIRIDRPGRMTVDFHTVGGGRTRVETPPLAGGGRRGEGKGTIVSHRHYLTDAAFTVAIISSAESLLTTLEAALRKPEYGPHLGRRSCPPAGPLVIGRHDDPLTALQHDIPLAREKPHQDELVTVDVDIITEYPPAQPGTGRTNVTNTHPESFGEPRAFRPHTTWQVPYKLPASLCAGYGPDYLDALLSYHGATP
jgi:CRISPR system Cascade subunit CasD